MIFITSDIAVGSKAFMYELAEAIRPALEKNWSDNELERFDLSLLQQMIHFGGVPTHEFNVAVKAVINAKNVDKRWQVELLQAMQADPRYQA